MIKTNTLKVFLLISCMVIAAANLSAEPAAAAPQSARGAIESFFAKVNAVKFPVVSSAEYERDAAGAGVYLDIAAMGQKALAAHWSVLNADEQKAFSDLLEKLIWAIAYPRAQKFLKEQMVTYAEPKTLERGVEIKSTMKSRETGLEIPVIYDLYSENGEWKIYDIFLDGISMTEDLQYQFDKIIATGGPAELLKQMQARLDRADRENAA